MDHEYTVSGACSINGVPAQSVNVAGPYGAQTVSYPGGNYSLFIRVPDGISYVTITASYPGYSDVSKGIDLNLTTSLDFGLVSPPVTYTVSGICRADGVPLAGVTVHDVTYDSSTVSGQDGAYRLNISVPYGETTWVRLVASKSGYDQDTATLDLNNTLAESFNLPVVAQVTALPSSAPQSTAKATAIPVNLTTSGIVGLISSNAYLLLAIIALLIVVVVGVVFYLKWRGKARKHEMLEPTREDIYRLVTGDQGRARRTRNDEHNGGHKKLK